MPFAVRALASLATGLALTAFTGAAFAEANPVRYTYVATMLNAANPNPVAALLGAGTQVSGSFIYNSGAALLGQSDDSGFESGLSIYGGSTAATASLYAIQGQVGGRAFSDIVGAVSVGNNAAGFNGLDFLTLIADAPPRPGATTTPTDSARQLVGFTIGDYTLHNVRVMWTGAGATDFLSSNDLPATLPARPYLVTLDFIRTDDPTNTAGVPYFSNSVTFYGTQMLATPVPEPVTSVLTLTGLCVMGAAGAVARRKAR